MVGTDKKKNILIVSKAYYYSLENVNMRKYLMLKNEFDGEFLGVTDQQDYRFREVDGFFMRCAYLPPKFFKIKILKNFMFIFYSIISSIYRHHFIKKYDLIIAREPIMAGPVALFIKVFTGAKLITELNGNYASDYVWEDIKNGFVRALKQKYCMSLIPVVIRSSSAVKLLYPDQASPYFKSEEDIGTKKYVFHEYTPLALFDKTPEKSKTILTMGYPYNIKGFDILIEAFKKIEHIDSEYQLHLVGFLWPQEREYLTKLIGESNQIHLLKPLDYIEAMKKMAGCSFFVLASRTEGMGRVLLEAMAHGKALIGSSADGIPHYVHNEENGLVFENGNITELAEKLKRFIKNKELRQSLGDRGFEMSRSEYSEQIYLDCYKAMMVEVCG